MPIPIRMLRSTILALTRQIKSQKPDKGAAILSRFSGPSPLLGMVTPGGEWWYTTQAQLECENLALTAMGYDSSLANGDRTAFCLRIRRVIEENAWNRELFNISLFFSKRIETLFEARSARDVNEFAEKLWGTIYRALLAEIMDWIVLYPLPRMNAPSFTLGFDGISLFPSNDMEAWERISQSYSTSNFWKPDTGEYRGRKFFKFIGEQPMTWICCESNGTQLGARRKSGRLMRTFLAVLFSHFNATVGRSDNIFYRSRTDVNPYSIQFSNQKVEYASLGILLQPLRDTIDISPDMLDEVSIWYRQLSSSNMENAGRARKGAHFIQYAMTTYDIENIMRFIHYFIAIDAFLGKQGLTQKSITEGIKRIIPGENKWVRRTERFFTIRSELVHGSSSSIDECEGITHYYRDFRSDPLQDIEFAAMTALRKYF